MKSKPGGWFRGNIYLIDPKKPHTRLVGNCVFNSHETICRKASAEHVVNWWYGSDRSVFFDKMGGLKWKKNNFGIINNIATRDKRWNLFRKLTTTLEIGSFATIKTTTISLWALRHDAKLGCIKKMKLKKATVKTYRTSFFNHLNLGVQSFTLFPSLRFQKTFGFVIWPSLFCPICNTYLRGKLLSVRFSSLQ